MDYKKKKGDVDQDKDDGPKRTLDYLYEARDDISGQGLSYNEILTESHIMLLAGTDTVSNGLTWLLYSVITHPQIEAKLQSELSTLEHDALDYQTCINELPYLMAVIKETLRCYPPGPIAFPRVVPDGGRTISGYFIPEGTEVGVPIYTLHNSKQLWKESDRFNPDRWFSESAKLNEETKNYVPFLLGPRVCLGKE